MTGEKNRLAFMKRNDEAFFGRRDEIDLTDNPDKVASPSAALNVEWKLGGEWKDKSWRVSARSAKCDTIHPP